jgi:hypothetical protein
MQQFIPDSAMHAKSVMKKEKLQTMRCTHPTRNGQDSAINFIDYSIQIPVA